MGDYIEETAAILASRNMIANAVLYSEELWNDRLGLPSRNLESAVKSVLEGHLA